MGKHIQKTDLDSQWAIFESNSTWILTEKAKITVTSGDAIIEMGPHDNSNIRVLGDIQVLSAGAASGVGFQGANSRLYVGENSSINAFESAYGVLMLGADARTVNDGSIIGGIYGVDATSGLVVNNGTIRGGAGMHFTTGGYEVRNTGDIIGFSEEAIGGHLADALIVNGKGGLIRAMADDTIETTGTGSGTIVNHGLIRSTGSAIRDEDGDLKVVNTGRIQGSAFMGDGTDTFDSRRGEVTGSVHGGMGHDTYFVGKAGLDIVETIGQGNDEVYATASYTMHAFIEQLSLLGKGDINGTGNELGNTMYGNAGRNVLKGMDGDDVITAGNGSDKLFGGDDVDTFQFATGDGHDRILDFVDGTDLISIEDINDEADFLALDVTDVKGGALIEYEGGSIFIKGVLASQITWQDDFAS